MFNSILGMPRKVTRGEGSKCPRRVNCGMEMRVFLKFIGKSPGVVKSPNLASLEANICVPIVI